MSTYSGKSDNNEICSLIPFVGVIILYPKSISWDLEFTNNFYKNFQLRYIHVRSIPVFMVKCSVKFARIQKFCCLISRLSLKLNFGVGVI